MIVNNWRRSPKGWMLLEYPRIVRIMSFKIARGIYNKEISVCLVSISVRAVS
jgi:hypothetical protein